MKKPPDLIACFNFLGISWPEVLFSPPSMSLSVSSHPSFSPLIGVLNPISFNSPCCVFVVLHSTPFPLCSFGCSARSLVTNLNACSLHFPSSQNGLSEIWVSRFAVLFAVLLATDLGFFFIGYGVGLSEIWVSRFPFTKFGGFSSVILLFVDGSVFLFSTVCGISKIALRSGTFLLLKGVSCSFVFVLLFLTLLWVSFNYDCFDLMCYFDRSTDSMVNLCYSKNIIVLALWSLFTFRVRITHRPFSSPALLCNSFYGFTVPLFIYSTCRGFSLIYSTNLFKSLRWIWQAKWHWNFQTFASAVCFVFHDDFRRQFYLWIYLFSKVFGLYFPLKDSPPRAFNALTGCLSPLPSSLLLAISLHVGVGFAYHHVGDFPSFFIGFISLKRKYLWLVGFLIIFLIWFACFLYEWGLVLFGCSFWGFPVEVAALMICDYGILCSLMFMLFLYLFNYYGLCKLTYCSLSGERHSVMKKPPDLSSPIFPVPFNSISSNEYSSVAFNGVYLSLAFRPFSQFSSLHTYRIKSCLLSGFSLIYSSPSSHCCTDCLSSGFSSTFSRPLSSRCLRPRCGYHQLTLHVTLNPLTLRFLSKPTPSDRLLSTSDHLSTWFLFIHRLGWLFKVEFLFSVKTTILILSLRSGQFQDYPGACVLYSIVSFIFLIFASVGSFLGLSVSYSPHLMIVSSYASIAFCGAFKFRFILMIWNYVCTSSLYANGFSCSQVQIDTVKLWNRKVTTSVFPFPSSRHIRVYPCVGRRRPLGMWFWMPFKALHVQFLATSINIWCIWIRWQILYPPRFWSSGWISVKITIDDFGRVTWILYPARIWAYGWIALGFSNDDFTRFIWVRLILYIKVCGAFIGFNDFAFKYYLIRVWLCDSDQACALFLIFPFISKFAVFYSPITSPLGCFWLMFLFWSLGFCGLFIQKTKWVFLLCHFTDGLTHFPLLWKFFSLHIIGCPVRFGGRARYSLSAQFLKATYSCGLLFGSLQLVATTVILIKQFVVGVLFGIMYELMMQVESLCDDIPTVCWLFMIKNNTLCQKFYASELQFILYSKAIYKKCHYMTMAFNELFIQLTTFKESLSCACKFLNVSILMYHVSYRSHAFYLWIFQCFYWHIVCSLLVEELLKTTQRRLFWTISPQHMQLRTSTIKNMLAIIMFIILGWFKNIIRNDPTNINSF